MSNSNLDAMAVNLANAAQDFATDQATISSLRQSVTDLQNTVAYDSSEIDSQSKTITALQAQIAASQKPTMPGLIYPGFTGQFVAHIEMSSQPHAPGATFPHPVDMKRWMGFDQHNADDVALDVDNMYRTGFDVVMPNSYPIGGFEHQALLLYLAEIKRRGMKVFPNLDKKIYGDAANRQAAIQAYIDSFLRKSVFPLGINFMWNGRYAVSFFDDGATPAATFAALAKANPDVEFVNNIQTAGGSQYSWMKAALGAGYPSYFTSWLKKYSALKDGRLYLPHFSPGFDDTWQGHEVWDATQPARVYPPGVGPSLDTIKWHFAQLNQFYGPSNQLQLAMAVTWSDLNEWTRICPDSRGNCGYFAFVR